MSCALDGRARSPKLAQAIINFAYFADVVGAAWRRGTVPRRLDCHGDLMTSRSVCGADQPAWFWKVSADGDRSSSGTRHYDRKVHVALSKIMVRAFRL